MPSDSGVSEVRDGSHDEETFNMKLKEYLELREKNIRKCHFSYRRRI